MTDLSQPGALSAIDRARLSAELMQIRAQLAGSGLTPLDRARASARGLVLRQQLGEASKVSPEQGQAAFDRARAFYQSTLKDQVVQSVVGPVTINGVGWRKAKMGMKADVLKARLIEHVREILETGSAGQRQAPTKTRNDSFVAFYFIQKQVQVDDLLVTAGVTVAEDVKGNLFYNVSHAGRESWQAKENGVTDVARVGPRESDDADNGMLDSVPQGQSPGAVPDTVADDDINITILHVVAAATARPAIQAKPATSSMVTALVPQKNGGVLAEGDPELLSAYAKAYLDLAKYTVTPQGLMFSKSQARTAQALPVAQARLPSGAVLYTFAQPDGVAVAYEGAISGTARNLDNLKSLMAQEWGPDKFRAVFGEEAAANDAQAYTDEQAAIAQRKQSAIADQAQAAKDAQLAQEQAQDQAKAQAEETARIVAEHEAAAQAEFERTIGAGTSDNPIYQAYLDTLEELPTTPSNAGFLGWAGLRAGEWERLGKGRISANKDEYIAWVRAWADEHLSERAKGLRAAPPQHQIIEYKTKRDKVLRGIIRADLSLAEAKAIDPYTWRINGGYFIREKHLTGDTSAQQAEPTPTVLTADQEAERQERDTRLALERQQQAISNQVAKLREAGAKAIESGTSVMNADRKTNTNRRAGMAASAYARGANDESEGATLNNIADAIEVGAGGALASLTSRTQLQELKKALNQAKYEAEKGLTYQQRLERNGQPFTADDVHHVRMPVPLVWSTRFRNAALNLAKKAPTGNSRLIAALTKMSNRVERWPLTDDGDIAITRKAHKILTSVKEGWDLKDPIEALARVDRLKRMGISTDSQLQDACRALLPHLAAKQEESAVTKAERAIIGQKVGIDFFPTPVAVAHRMASLAGISKGTRVLEPSAGNGNLADAAAAAGGEVDVVEISSQLREILSLKGYTVVASDFDDFAPEALYPAIVMNPPFSKRQDAEHIMRAFTMLAGGGTLVAIAGEGVFFGQDQKAVQFRAWLDSHNATVEKLEGGTFTDNALLAQTTANARLIVLKK